MYLRLGFFEQSWVRLSHFRSQFTAIKLKGESTKN